MQDENNNQSLPKPTPLPVDQPPVVIPEPSQPAIKEPLPPLIPEEDYVLQPYIVADAPKKNMLLINLIFAAIAIVGLLAAGFAYYFYIIRLPDQDYTSSSSLIDKMTADIATIEKDNANDRYIHGAGRTTATTASAVLTTTTTSTPESEADKYKPYQDALTKSNDLEALIMSLKATDTVTKDSVIKSTYAKSDKTIETYSTFYTQLNGTIIIFGKATDACFVDPGSLKTVQQYTTALLPCMALFKQYPHVPLKAFDDEIYQPVVTLFTSFNTDLDNLVEAIQTHNVVEYDQVDASINKLDQSLKDLTEKVSNYHITPPTNPTSALSDLKTAIQNRQKVFLR